MQRRPERTRNTKPGTRQGPDSARAQRLQRVGRREGAGFRAPAPPPHPPRPSSCALVSPSFPACRAHAPPRALSFLARPGAWTVRPCRACALRPPGVLGESVMAASCGRFPHMGWGDAGRAGPLARVRRSAGSAAALCWPSSAPCCGASSARRSPRNGSRAKSRRQVRGGTSRSRGGGSPLREQPCPGWGGPLPHQPRGEEAAGPSAVCPAASAGAAAAVAPAVAMGYRRRCSGIPRRGAFLGFHAPWSRCGESVTWASPSVCLLLGGASGSNVKYVLVIAEVGPIWNLVGARWALRSLLTNPVLLWGQGPWIWVLSCIRS